MILNVIECIKTWILRLILTKFRLINKIMSYYSISWPIRDILEFKSPHSQLLNYYKKIKIKKRSISNQMGLDFRESSQSTTELNCI